MFAAEVGPRSRTDSCSYSERRWVNAANPVERRLVLCPVLVPTVGLVSIPSLPPNHRMPPSYYLCSNNEVCELSGGGAGEGDRAAVAAAAMVLRGSGLLSRCRSTDPLKNAPSSIT